LEERVVKLEYELDLARTELRLKGGYIDNLKVYEGIVNGYVLRLKERLEGLEPGCRLLEYRIPAMPEQRTRSESEAASNERSDAEITPLADVVDGTVPVEGHS
jgi:hypothetical protein